MQNELRRAIDRLPRAALARLPTPLDELPNFGRALGGVRVLVKREDMTGLAFGGNKTRELDFFIGAAEAEGAGTFVAGGGAAQSNHAVQCAAAARRRGLDPVLLLHGSPSEFPQGNELLTRILDARVHFVPPGEDPSDAAMDRRNDLEPRMRELAAQYEKRGRRVYVLPSSFHPLGAVAYADCGLELLEQLNGLSIRPDHLYVTSAGATQAGLVLAFKLLEAQIPVQGISYTANAPGLKDRLARLGTQTALLLGVETTVNAEDILTESFAGPGYGQVSPAGREAMQLLARTEGMFVDPVYNAKGLAGLIEHVSTGRIKSGETVVFVHTGGLPAIFGHSEELLQQR
jgi:1-aminocyclopropane-1-carboxylate deaminase/D-cysteine desulfhydrase-like pyridoxal-dependent ACC family enzyme